MDTNDDNTFLFAIGILLVVIIIVVLYIKKHPTDPIVVAYEKRVSEILAKTPLLGSPSAAGAKSNTASAAPTSSPTPTSKPSSAETGPTSAPSTANVDAYYKNEQNQSLKVMGSVIAAQIAVTITAKLVKTKVAGKIGLAAAKLASKAIQNLGVKLGSKALQAIGIKIAEKAMTEIAVKAGESGAAKLAMGSTMGPLGIAADALMVVGIGLDLGDAGGYMKMGTKEMYHAIRADIWESFKKAFTDKGIAYPIVYGPLDKLNDSDPTAFGKEQEAASIAITSDKNEPLMQKFNGMITAYIQNNPTATGDDLGKYIDSIYDSAVDMDAVMAKATSQICVSHGGVMKDGYCKYTTPASCKASMVWPPADGNDSTFVEWDADKGECVVASTGLYTICKENGLGYNWENRMCDITEDYCKSKGAKWGDNPNIKEKDCIVPIDQQVFEALFGTTITRGAIQLFDPNQYCSCRNGTDEAGPYLCNSCNPEHPQKIGSLCYDKCPPGMQDSGFGCRKTCPTDGRFDQTLLTCTKKTVGANKKPCPPGMRDDGTSCWRDSIGNGVGTIPRLNDCPANSWSNDVGDCIGNIVNRQDDVNWGETLWSHSDDKAGGRDGCSWNRHVEGAMCYRDCPQGYFGRGDARCYANGADSFGVMKRSWDRGNHCDPNQSNVAGLCYNNCPSGYHFAGGNICEPDRGPGIKVNLFDRQYCPDGYKNIGGICWPDCPPNGFSDGGAFCNRPGFERAPYPVNTIPKQRKIAFSSKDGTTTTNSCPS
jgi:hypothetical protein